MDTNVTSSLTEDLITDVLVEKINSRMFRRRLDQNKYDELSNKWNFIEMRDIRTRQKKTREVIRELLKAGKKVTAGYFTTGCRGFHEHVILWRD